MRHSLLPLVFASSTLVACTSDSEPPAPEQSQLDSALQTFEVSVPPSYSFTYEFPCGLCQASTVQPIRITVTDDEITSAVYPGDQPVPEQFRGNLATLRGLLDRVQLYIDEGADVDVTYDPTLGYPATASNDPLRAAVDDETGWTVTDYLAPPAVAQ